MTPAVPELYDRRLQRIPVSFQLLIALMQGKSFGCGPFIPVCIKAIPSDAVFIYSYTDDEAQLAYLVFWHENFPLIPQGEEIPEFSPTFQTPTFWRPFDGVRVEMNIEGTELMIYRDPSRATWEYVKPNPSDFSRSVTFEDGSVSVQQFAPYEDHITLRAKDVSLPERVRYVRDAVRGVDQLNGEIK